MIYRTKFCVILLAILTVMLSECNSQQETDLSGILKNWIKNPQSELSRMLYKDDFKKEFKVSTEYEAKLICDALIIIKEQIKSGFNKEIDNNLHSITALFQSVSTQESYKYLDAHGIDLLVEIMNVINSQVNYDKSLITSDLFIIKIFAYYKNKNGLSSMVKYIKENYQSGNYFWEIAFQVLSQDSLKYNYVISELKGYLPEKFLGITYLDMCNEIALHNKSFIHPFNSENGYLYLKNVIIANKKKDESYVASATSALPYLKEEYRKELYPLIADNDNIEVQIEATWTGARTGEKKSIDKLIEYAKDYRYHERVSEYIKALHLEGQISEYTNKPDFVALCDMCGWLSHPMEYGKYPDNAEIIYQKELYWPPTKDRRTIYLIKYTYKSFNVDGSDDVGIGMVGSTVWSFYSINNILTMKPIELLGMYCIWEIQKGKIEDSKKGIDLLKKYNPELE